MKKYIYPLAVVAALTAATSCNDDDIREIVENKPDSEKEMISFSAGLGENSLQTTRAYSTPNYVAFSADTRVIMRLESDDKSNGSNHRYTKSLATAKAKVGTNWYSIFEAQGDAYIRYWDDAFGRNAQLSVYAVAIPGKSSADLLPENKLKGSSSSWETTANDNKISWIVDSDKQTVASDASDAVKNAAKIQVASELEDQDLTYSNNIQADGDLGKGGRYVWNFSTSKYVPNIEQPITGANVFSDGRMVFTCSSSTDATAPGKFDKGHLVFQHGLSRITITLKSGSGINPSTGFVLNTTGTNGIKALTVPVKGDLDVKAGTWSNTATGEITVQPTKVIERAVPDDATSAVTGAHYTASMQMLPDYEFTKGGNTNVLSFEIDNNTYYVTQGMIFTALTTGTGSLTDMASASLIKMLQGKNYNLTITVNKTKIESVTATLAEWVDVAADVKDVYNSYITLALNPATGSACRSFDLYRLPHVADNIYTSNTTPTADSYENYSWKGDYTQKATLTETETNSNVWKTNWFFEDNKTFYHFRTVNTGTTITTTDDDYFTVNHGAVASVDPHWGAPMKNGATFKYEPNADAAAATTPQEGYSTSIYKAIGSTTNTIAIQELHMLSEIQVIVKSVDGTAAVQLFDDKGDQDASNDVKTIVKLTKFYGNGQVKMGSGFVTPTGDLVSTQEMTQPTTGWTNNTIKTTAAFTWRVVPQALSRGDGNANKIGIEIKTPDDNVYYVIQDLSTIVPSGITIGSTAYDDPNHTKWDDDSNSETPDVYRAIDRWYPNHRYIYTFTLSKKGIEAITCTLADWVTVTGTDTPIDLEN